MSSPNVESRRLSNENGNAELRTLRETAKIASIYHGQQQTFRKNTNLSHVAHASLHFAEFIVALAIELFHHIHHRVSDRRREHDLAYPVLPEERNPIFFVYPVCTVLSLVFGIMWLCEAVIIDNPTVCLASCFGSAGFMLIAGIMEMKHVDKYIDLAEVTDEDLIRHPIFIHNFVMCLLSIFCMTLYLVHGWILCDLAQSTNWGKRKSQVSEAVQTTLSTIRKHSGIGRRERKLEEPGELKPIAALDNFPTLRRISRPSAVEDEPIILYCCIIDCCNYLMKNWKPRAPMHEFQVVHVM